MCLQTLKGSVVFMCDLVRCMYPLPETLQIEYIRASSYGDGTETSGEVNISMSTLTEDAIQGRHLLLVRLDIFLLMATQCLWYFLFFVILPSASVAYNIRWGVILTRLTTVPLPTDMSCIFHRTCSLFTGLHFFAG